FDRGELEMMLSDRLEVQLDNIAGAGRYEKQVFDVIQWATRKRKLGQLVDAVTQETPGLANTISLAAAPPVASAAPSNLERLVRNGEGIERYGPMLERFLALQGQVCRIEAAANGTGFLVAPDLVLTNFHVLEGEIGAKNY